MTRGCGCLALLALAALAVVALQPLRRRTNAEAAVMAAAELLRQAGGR